MLVDWSNVQEEVHNDEDEEELPADVMRRIKYLRELQVSRHVENGGDIYRHLGVVLESIMGCVPFADEERKLTG